MFDELFGENQPSVKWLCPGQKPSTIFVDPSKSGVSVKLDCGVGKNILTFEKSLPIKNMAEHIGKKIRFYIWVKAETPSADFIGIAIIWRHISLKKPIKCL
jgi:hypothetical protein